MRLPLQLPGKKANNIPAILCRVYMPVFCPSLFLALNSQDNASCNWQQPSDSSNHPLHSPSQQRLPSSWRYKHPPQMSQRNATIMADAPCPIQVENSSERRMLLIPSRLL